jgi:hypothetical protein
MNSRSLVASILESGKLMLIDCSRKLCKPHDPTIKARLSSRSGPSNFKSLIGSVKNDLKNFHVAKYANIVISRVIGFSCCAVAHFPNSLIQWRHTLATRWVLS